jgi:hypothetical protein
MTEYEKFRQIRDIEEAQRKQWEKEKPVLTLNGGTVEGVNVYRDGGNIDVGIMYLPDGEYLLRLEGTSYFGKYKHEIYTQ